MQEETSMIRYIFRGILIGLLFGLPAGAVGAMTVQRTWNHGVRAGLLTGLGSSVADCLYACVGAFGLTVISDFLLTYQTVIRLAGGALVLYMGIHLLFEKAEGGVSSVSQTGASDQTGFLPMFLSSFMIGITNPAAIVTFMFAFSFFGISGQTGLIQGTGLVFGVFAGTYFWWGALSLGVNLLRKNRKKSCFGKMNHIFGMILILLGAAVLVQAVLA